MKVLILTKGNKQLIFKVASIPYALGVEYGWQISQLTVAADTQLNEYSEIRN